MKKDWSGWNDEYFKKTPMSRLYNHPNPLVRLIERSRRVKIVQFSSINPNDRVLEIGCEEGPILEQLPESKLCVGLEISSLSIKRAKQKLSSRCDFVKADGQRLPFKSNTFNVVICSETLEHVPKPEDIVEESYRVLRKGGRFIVTVPYETYITSGKRFVEKLGLMKLLFKGIKGDTTEFHIHNFTPAQLYSLILSGKFIIKKKHVFPFPIIGPIISVVAEK